MDIESRGTSWLSQLTAEYGVNSSMEVAQVEPYLIMMSMIMTITMMTTTMSNLGGRLSHLPLLHHLLSHHCWLWQRCRQHEAGKAFLRPCHVCWRCLFLDSHQLTRSNNPSALMHATIFGNVVSIVGRMYGRRAEYDKKVKLKVSVVPIFCFRCSTWNTLPGFTNCQRMCARG